MADLDVIRVFLCEYAAIHKDGTFSVIRGGIDFWTVEALPLELRLWVLIDVPPSRLQAGPHRLLASLTSSVGVVVS
jgi:hypothetical protein